MEPFRFKRFQVKQERSALKLGTDAVLLGASMTIKGDERRMLDIGTGTGVIALMAAQRRSAYQRGFDITGIDIDGPSAEEAAENFAASPWSWALESRHCALKDYRPSEKFELIFSNPPYYDSSLENPDARLAGARHTNSLPRQELMAFAAENLADGGRLSIILPSDEEKATLRLAASFGLRPFRLVRFKTTPAKAAKRTVLEFSFSRTECREETLVIGADTETMTAPFYL